MSKYMSELPRQSRHFKRQSDASQAKRIVEWGGQSFNTQLGPYCESPPSIASRHLHRKIHALLHAAAAICTSLNRPFCATLDATQSTRVSCPQTLSWRRSSPTIGSENAELKHAAVAGLGRSRVQSGVSVVVNVPLSPPPHVMVPCGLGSRVRVSASRLRTPSQLCVQGCCNPRQGGQLCVQGLLEERQLSLLPRHRRGS